MKPEDAPHRPPHSEPWIPPIRGTEVWILADEISARALAAGHITARLQVQAARLVHFLEHTESDHAGDD